MTCCTTPLPAHTEVNCQLISSTVPSSSNVMQAYSSPLLLSMFCFSSMFVFALLPSRSLLLLDFPLSLVFAAFTSGHTHSWTGWFTLHPGRGTPLKSSSSSSSPLITHMQTHTHMWWELGGQSDISSDLLWTQQGPRLTPKAAVRVIKKEW